MDKGDKIALLFDGVCNLCNDTVRFVIKRDKHNKFVFAALQSEVGQKLLKKFNLSRDDFDSFVLIENGKCFRKSTATLKIAKGLGGSWKVLYVLMLVPEFLRDFFYSIVAKNRYRIFGKKEECMIPTPELKEKFLG